MWRLATLTIVITAAMVAPAAGQRRVHVGAKVGPSFTTIALEEDDGRTYHRRIAAAGGGFVVLPLAARVAAQFEVLSNPKGSRLEEPGDTFTQTMKLRYLEFPVLLRVAGPKQRIGAWYLMGGGSFGVRTGATAEIASVTNSIMAGERSDASALIERFEGGVVAGAGLNAGRYLVVEGRYGRGLTNVNKVADSPRFTNRALTFMVGVRY
jgi:hypothetical protein